MKVIEFGETKSEWLTFKYFPFAFASIATVANLTF